QPPQLARQVAPPKDTLAALQAALKEIEKNIEAEKTIIDQTRKVDKRTDQNPLRILTALLVFALLLPLAFAQTQQSLGALERGYRTGYSDGYQAGYSDSTQAAARDYKSKDEYQRADRAYVAAYGTLEDYRDGYQQG